MITTLTLKCPNCGADIEVDSSREFCFCQYCGTKVLLSDENKKTINLNIDQNITNHIIDDAEIIRAKTEEFVAKKTISTTKVESYVDILKSIPLGIVVVILFVISRICMSISFLHGFGQSLSLASFLLAIIAIFRFFFKKIKGAHESIEHSRQLKAEREEQRLRMELEAQERQRQHELELKQKRNDAIKSIFKK